MSALQHQTSIILQPDGELIRAIVDPATVQRNDEGIQFQLGMLAQKVLQEEQPLHFATDTDAPATKLSPGKAEPVRGNLTITTARKSITGAVVHQETSTTSKTAFRANNSKNSTSTQALQAEAQRTLRADNASELATVSSVSLDAIPGLRKQASVTDPAQTKQLEKGWGLSYKDASLPVSVRKEVEVSPPGQQDNLARIKQLNSEREALARQRADAEQAKQQAEEERKEAERQAKAAARRAALEAAAARREEDARKRQEFRQETSKVKERYEQSSKLIGQSHKSSCIASDRLSWQQQMYKAAIQQEEQNTPAFVRLQQQAEAKEEEARAEKQRRWEEQVASKKFWFADIQASLEPATSSAKATSASRAASEAATSPTLSPDASQGLLQEASQGSLDQPHASGSAEKKAKGKREWQQSLRSSGRFQPPEGQKPQPWGLSQHTPNLQRRLKYHQTQERGCSPMGGSSGDLGFHDEPAEAEEAAPKVDLLDENVSLTELAQSLHPEQWQDARPEVVGAVAAMQSSSGPLVHLMQSLTTQASTGLAMQGASCITDADSSANMNTGGQDPNASSDSGSELHKPSTLNEDEQAATQQDGDVDLPEMQASISNAVADGAAQEGEEASSSLPAHLSQAGISAQSSLAAFESQTELLLQDSVQSGAEQATHVQSHSTQPDTVPPSNILSDTFESPSQLVASQQDPIASDQTDAVQRDSHATPVSPKQSQQSSYEA